MDHDKPEAAVININDSLGLEPLRESTHSTIRPDVEYANITSPDEQANIDDRKEDRGVRLWYA
jgi:hypothetical protein